MTFPYGQAPFWILMLAIGTGLATAVSHRRFTHQPRADLVLLTHAKLHADVYREMLPKFEQRHGVRVDIQLLDVRALRSRLNASFLSGTAVPDLVELNENIAFFARGPLEEMGFADLTDWVEETRLQERIIPARFAAYSTRGRIFALPHDIHPVMLAYRADIVEDELGLNPREWTTWERFAEAAHPLTRDLDGDGRPDRYALEMPPDGRAYLLILLLQRDGGHFDAEGRVTLDDERTLQTVLWWVRGATGPRRFGFDPGTGQPFYRALEEGLVLFYFMPDWRTRMLTEYAPALAGKMKLMPLPAWTEGGRRTSTWSATGMAITKRARDPALARQLADYLYLSHERAGEYAARLQILPPGRDTWFDEIFDRPSPYFSGQPFMRLYADLAPDVPPVWVTPYSLMAQNKLVEATLNISRHYERRGEEGLAEFATAELRRAADQVRALMARNRFLDP